MHSQTTPEEEAGHQAYLEENERQKQRYIQSPEYRSNYVSHLELSLSRYSYLERWAIRLLENPSELNLDELSGLLKDIKKGRGF